MIKACLAHYGPFINYVDTFYGFKDLLPPCDSHPPPFIDNSVRPNHRTTEPNRNRFRFGSVRLGRFYRNTEPYRTYRNLPKQPKLTEPTETNRTYRNLPKQPKPTEPTEPTETNRTYQNLPINCIDMCKNMTPCVHCY